MNGRARALQEAMLTRDEAEIRTLARDMASAEGDESLFHAVSRFAALAYNPSQHAKHALLATLAAWEVRGSLGESLAAVLGECAVYVANARLPWSEAPMLDPPPIEGQDESLDEAVAAIEAHDSIRLQSWLAARIRRGEVREAFFEVAASDLRDFGHPFVVATAAWKLSLLQETHPSYPALRIAAVEWAAVRDGDAPDIRPERADAELVRAVTARVIGEKGAVEAFHDLVLLDAALDAQDLGAPAHVVARVKAAVPADPAVVAPALPRETNAPVYPLARDYAELLLAHAIAARLERRGLLADAIPLVSAAGYNLRSSSFDEWSFA